MKTSAILLIAAIATHGASAEKITNEDVVRLIKAGLSPETIALKIRYSDTSFDTSTAALIALREAGVPDATVRLMLEKQKDAPFEPAPAPAVSTESVREAAAPSSAPPSRPDTPATTPVDEATSSTATGKTPATSPAPGPREPSSPSRSVYEVAYQNSASGATCSSGFLRIDDTGIALTGCLGSNFTLKWTSITSACAETGESAAIRLTTASGTRRLSAATVEMRDEIFAEITRGAPSGLVLESCKE